MTKASDNDYPSILLSEQGSAPTSPAASHQRLYIKSSDHLYYTVNSSGTVTAVGGSGSSVPTAHACTVCRASGNVSLGTNTLTVIPFTSELLDTDTMHDNSTNPSRVIIPTISGVTTGLWLITATGYTDNSSNPSDSMFRVNAAGSSAGGTLVAFARYTQNTATPVTLTATYVFTAADYVEWFVRVLVGSGNLLFDSTVSPLMSVSFLGKVT